VKAIARQVASALRAAHRAGVVHRDLKPDNVFLTPSEAGGVVIERVKLLDFGISKLTAEAATGITHDQVLMGTPRYMSPEQAVGKNSDVDERTDIFALGSIVYEMLAGRPPFTGENTAQVVFQIVQAVPEPIALLCPSLPRRAAAAIARAMAKEARERFPDVESFVAALTGEPLHSLSGLGGTPVPARRTAARRRVPWIVAGALGLSSMVAWGGLTWWGRVSPGRAGSTAAVHGGAGGPAGGASGPSGAEAAAGAPVPGSEVPVGPPAAIPSVSPAALPSVPPAVIPSAKPAPEKAGSRPLAPPSKAVTSPARSATPSAQAVAPSEKSVTAPARRAGQPSKAPAAASRSAVAPPERAQPPERTASRTPSQRPTPEARTQDARGLLSGAHRALAAGEARKAIELARRAERGDPSLPTAPVLTMAYCALGDLGNARPELARVRWGQRRFVRRFCARQGLDLGER
jgi:serine/threonine-protein kinase